VLGYRAATAGDVEAVAGLHADSWRRTYRGAYSDAFLDGDVFADRLRVWSGRLDAPGADHFTIVAERAGSVVGFAHTILDSHPELGALLENLHVSNDLKGQGVGTRLLAESADSLIERRPASGLFLSVLEQNTAAQAFYDARGGTLVARRIGGPFPGGGTAPVFVYSWPDPSRLLGRG
jgi:ribosomal protein S18 acetylase RimI-like enzyme